MNSILDNLRLYFRLLGVSLRGQMQYRASFLMLAAGQFLITGMEFVGIWALFDRFGSLRGWSLPEVALLYGTVNVAFAFADAFSRSFDNFPNLIKQGEFDRVLLRPRGTALQVAGQELTLMRAGRLIQGLMVLLWAAGNLGLAWTPAKVTLLLGAVAGGACLFTGLFILQATMAFWTVETLEIMNTVTYGGTETAQFPMSIYRPWFRRFFTVVVPLACVNYLPMQAILGRADGPRLLGWLAPLAGPAFLLVALRAWRFGVRHYHSTGS